jgi:hypothetical protein
MLYQNFAFLNNSYGITMGDPEGIQPRTVAEEATIFDDDL